MVERILIDCVINKAAIAKGYEGCQGECMPLATEEGSDCPPVHSTTLFLTEGSPAQLQVVNETSSPGVIELRRLLGLGLA